MCLRECRCIAMEIKAKGEMAEWSIAAVLKTVEGHTSGGSNPSLSAQESQKTPTESFSRLLLNCDIPTVNPI